MAAVTRWLRARADDVAVGLLTALFGAFVVQIASRYVFNTPVGWSVELCLTLWVWTVFWGCAFCLSDSDHVKFDILYLSGSPKVRRAMAIVSALAISGGLIAAMPATIDYITFYKIKKSATLAIRLDYVFSIYGIFAAAIVLRYLWRIVSILRGRSPDGITPDHDLTVGGEDIHRP